MFKDGNRDTGVKAIGQERQIVRICNTLNIFAKSYVGMCCVSKNGCVASSNDKYFRMRH